MYMLNAGPEAGCDNPYLAQARNRLPEHFEAPKYRINPNSRHDFTQKEEEYVLFPKTKMHKLF